MATTPQGEGVAPDPSAALAAAYERIAREHMVGVPILNPALRVQAVDFHPWQGYWLGALVTPWFLNLVLLPRDASARAGRSIGERRFHRFGAGDFAFLASHEPEVGAFESCSLVSPMGDFADQDSACATARAALRMLQVEQPAAALVGVTTPPAVTPAPAGSQPPPPTRRSWLLGRSAAARGPA